MQRERRGRLFGLAERLGHRRWPRPGTHPWANYLDQRIIDTPHYNRLREELRLGRAAQQHLEPARPRRGPRRRPRDRGLRPPARAAAAAAGALGELAVPRRPATPACTRCAPRSSPAPSRAAGSTSRSATGRPTPTSSTCSTRTELDRRVDPALVERAPAPRASARSRCGSATRRPAARSRSRSPALITACIAQAALDYDDGPARRRRCASARSRRTSGGRSATGSTARMIDFDAAAR